MSYVSIKESNGNTLNQKTINMFKVCLLFIYLFIMNLVVFLFVLILNFDYYCLFIILKKFNDFDNIDCNTSIRKSEFDDFDNMNNLYLD